MAERSAFAGVLTEFNIDPIVAYTLDWQRLAFGVLILRFALLYWSMAYALTLLVGAIANRLTPRAVFADVQLVALFVVLFLTGRLQNSTKSGAGWAILVSGIGCPTAAWLVLWFDFNVRGPILLFPCLWAVVAVRAWRSLRKFRTAMSKASAQMGTKLSPSMKAGRTDYGRASLAGRALVFRVLSAISAPVISTAIMSVSLLPAIVNELLPGRIAGLSIAVLSNSIPQLAVTGGFLWVFLDRILDDRFRLAAADRYEKISDKDSRPQVLFLRSFRDDRIVVDQGAQLFRQVVYLLSTGPIVWIAWMIDGPRRFSVRLYSILADQLWRVGPVVGAREPGEAPPGGIAVEDLSADERGTRDASSRDSWRDQVAERIQRSALIVFLIGAGHNLAFEVETTLRRGHSRKLAILFRPSALENVNRWYDLRDQLDSVVDLPDLGGERLQTAIALVPRPGGWTLLSSKKKLEAQYRVACSLLAAAAEVPNAADSAVRTG